MQPRTPRHLAVLACLLWAAAAWPGLAAAQDEDDVASTDGDCAFATDTVKPAAGLSSFLQNNGFGIKSDLSIKRDADGLILGRELLEKAGLKYTVKGELVYRINCDPVSYDQLTQKLNALALFVPAQTADREAVGKTLREWGVPQVFNGDHLMNPDGTATYYGLMFYAGLKNSPGAVSHISGERLKTALDLFESAHAQAFDKGYPDVAQADLERAWGMLKAGTLQAGETPLHLEPRGDVKADLKDWTDRTTLTQQPPVDAADRRKTLTALIQIKKARYHSDLDLSEPPGRIAKGEKKSDQVQNFIDLLLGPSSKDSRPSQKFLPSVLRMMDKLNGQPLTPAQQQWLIESFPMGELVWRMHAQELWKDELARRQEVKVAVIDDGFHRHPDLEGVGWGGKWNFTGQENISRSGEHGTHVVGIIKALVGDAQVKVNVYKALPSGNSSRRIYARDDDERIVAAIDQAVADGNQIISMSLGGPGYSKDKLNETVDKYAKQGIIFSIAAGNEGAEGVSSPSTAQSALTVGNLDVNGRLDGDSGFGPGWDPRDRRNHVKTVLLAPGDDIVSTVPPASYEKQSGTSMATPVVTAVISMLYQKVKSLNGGASPQELRDMVEKVLVQNGQPLPRNQLPAGAPADQPFLIVDAPAAYNALCDQASVAKK